MSGSLSGVCKDFAALPTRQTDGTGDDFVRLRCTAPHQLMFVALVARVL